MELARELVWCWLELARELVWCWLELARELVWYFCLHQHVSLPRSVDHERLYPLITMFGHRSQQTDKQQRCVVCVAVGVQPP